jgi:hypothetical protein
MMLRSSGILVLGRADLLLKSIAPAKEIYPFLIPMGLQAEHTPIVGTDGTLSVAVRCVAQALEGDLDAGRLRNPCNATTLSQRGVSAWAAACHK